MCLALFHCKIYNLSLSVDLTDWCRDTRWLLSMYLLKVSSVFDSVAVSTLRWQIQTLSLQLRFHAGNRCQLFPQLAALKLGWTAALLPQTQSSRQGLRKSGTALGERKRRRKEEQTEPLPNPDLLCFSPAEVQTTLILWLPSNVQTRQIKCVTMWPSLFRCCWCYFCLLVFSSDSSDVNGRGHRRIGGQNLRAINHVSSPAAAPSPTAGTSVSKQWQQPATGGAIVMHCHDS